MAAATLPPPAPGELHLAQKQPRDFRRTAMVRMVEAGVRVQDIAAVSGHTIEPSQKNRMAQNASRQWEPGAPIGEALAQELRAGGQLTPRLALVPCRAFRPRTDAALARVQRGPEQSPTRSFHLIEKPRLFRRREYRIYSPIRRSARKSPGYAGV
jgi:hypothetical protein